MNNQKKAIFLCTVSFLLLASLLPLSAAALSPAQDAFSWELPMPQDIAAGEKTAAVIYKQVHETVYAACPLYVRSGPGTMYDFIGKLAKGEVVRRGAIGNNGWSQILYDGQEAYVSTIHLSVSPITPDEMSPEGSTEYRETGDSVRAIRVTKLRNGPGTDYAVIGHLTEGSGALRLSLGSSGWSKLLFHDTVAYAVTADLTCGSLSPDDPILEQKILPAEAPVVETSQAELPTPNAPFIYQYIAPPNIMPHAIFTPAEADLSKPLPLIISLHGALEIGEAPDTLKHNFITREFLNWEYTGLAGFDAYIVCPQLTGYGYGTTWRDPDVADKFFELLDYLKKCYNIDETRIILEGHSLGGEGVFYMGADPRACFSALVPISAYNPYVPVDSIHCAVRGYTGSPFLPAPREDWDSYNFMQKSFSQYFGSQNLSVKNCSHYDIPMVAFEEDLDRDGKSDLISWMLSQ